MKGASVKHHDIEISLKSTTTQFALTFDNALITSTKTDTLPPAAGTVPNGPPNQGIYAAGMTAGVCVNWAFKLRMLPHKKDVLISVQKMQEDNGLTFNFRGTDYPQSKAVHPPDKPPVFKFQIEPSKAKSPRK